MSARSIIFSLLFLVIPGGIGLAQVVPNRGLVAADLELARTIVLEAGGDKAQLIYANRLDLVTPADFDSLVVIYSVGSEYRALIDRAGNRFPLTIDGQSWVVPPGDSFRRSGLNRPASGPATLRLITTFRDSKGEEWQRNLDFQFNGTEFVTIGRSVSR